jgi:hypothetical protein
MIDPVLYLYCKNILLENNPDAISQRNGFMLIETKKTHTFKGA